jgi:uncharacterized protein
VRRKRVVNKVTYRYFIAITVLMLVGCSRAVEITVTSTANLVGERTEFPQISPTLTLVPPTVTPTSTSTSEPTLTGTATVTFTPDPYDIYTISYLANRDYGGGNLNVEEMIADTSYFTRYLVTYPSDGLTIYGFANIPKTVSTPYPVVIALHGYIDPEIYTTLDYTTGYADAMARAGYIVIHPNLRNYPPSDAGDNLFRVGMAIDVLNLVSIIEAQSGQPGILEQADADAIGIWGHSMGGGISLRVLTVSPMIRGAVLYGAMSGDEQRNFEAIFRWSGGERGLDELAIPTEELTDISPIYYLDRITAPVSIHHGESDSLVPIQWSLELCDALGKIGKDVECFTYPGQPHTFNGEGEALFNQRVVDFFSRIFDQ